MIALRRFTAGKRIVNIMELVLPSTQILTIKMNQELGPIQKFIQFLYSIGLPPMRILRGLIAIVLIGAVIAGIYFFNFGDLSRSARSDEDEQESPTATSTREDDRPNYEFELTVDQQIDEMLYFNPDPVSYVVVASEFLKQNENIATLRQQGGLSDLQSTRLGQIELRNSRVLVERQMLAAIDATESLNSFESLAQSFVDGPDETLQDLASYSLAKTSLTKLGYFPTEANAKQVIETLQTQKPSFLNNPNRVQLLLSQLLGVKDKNPDNTFIGGILQSIGQTLIQSDESEIVRVGNQIAEFSLFDKFGMSTLAKRIRYQDNDALVALDNALRVLESNPDVKMNIWTILMGASEALLSNKKISDFQTAHGILDDLVMKLPDSHELKAKLTKRLESQVKRLRKVGTSFDARGKTIQGRPILPSTSEYTLLLFCSRNEESGNMMAELMKKGPEAGGTFRPIVSFKDAFAENDYSHLNLIPDWVFVSSDETANLYKDEFSVDAFPYLFLIDKSGVVVELNLSIVQAQNRIAAIEMKNRDNKQ